MCALLSLHRSLACSLWITAAAATTVVVVVVVVVVIVVVKGREPIYFPLLHASNMYSSATETCR